MARQKRGWSVRARLLIVALLPMLLVMPLLIGITMQRWLWRTDQILAARVASDLTVAQQYLAHLTDSTGAQVAALARSAALRDNSENLAVFLQDSRAEMGLDYLQLTDPAGRLPSGVMLPVRSGIAVFGTETLAALSPALSASARIARITEPDTPSDAPRVETRGMVIHAAQPVTLPGGKNALLTGGILLNNNTAFVDRINELVYPGSDQAAARAIPGGFDRGVTSLFLDDIRITTTLRPMGSDRAIGTRASAKVRDHVLDQGISWHDTAMVVGEWYISAYEAITDMNGARVGMLYTGIPKAPYLAARQVTWMIIGGAFLIAVLLSVPLFLHWVRGIFRPLEAMDRTIALVESGHMDARTLTPNPPTGADEVLRLARHLDRLLAALQQRDHDLRILNADLNRLVGERTQDLTETNRALEVATRQLVLSEKLATIGEVTAGVAHEINNPLAVMQGNLEILAAVMANQGGGVETELGLIDEQIRRISALVNQLLQFTRPEEFAAGETRTDPSQAISALPSLIQHMLQGIELETDTRATWHIAMNPHELQQVLVNLVTNAIQSMPDGGRIVLTCRDEQHPDHRHGVRLTLRDSGPGMDAATLARIFDPFFTTRGTRGTGLGLSICQMLITRQGGVLSAESSPGKGALFSVWLPTA